MSKGKCQVMSKNTLAGYAAVESLRDGRSLTIRAIRPEDSGRVTGALKELSADSFYRRTFSQKRELSDTELKRMTNVDFETIVGLVAVMHENGQDHIVGGGRYHRMGDGGRSAEVAFLVDDQHQGCGIGSRIFRHLVAIARSRGILSFEAEVLPSNDGMLRLFNRSGLQISKTMSEDTVHVTIELVESKSPA